MSSYRPRRTRIYDANYDIGERYYKKQLDDLDNKYNPSFSSLGASSASSLGSKLARDFTPLHDEHFPSKVTFMDDDEDLAFANKLKNIKRKNVLDFEADDDVFGASMDSTSSRIKRESSKLKERMHNDFLKTSNDFGLKAERRSPFVDDLDDQMQSTTRRLKMRTENIFADTSSSLSEGSVQANSRAKASKARLAELECEMENLTEKQNEREKRNRNLRKLLDESDAAISSEVSSSFSSSFKKVET